MAQFFPFAQRGVPEGLILNQRRARTLAALVEHGLEILPIRTLAEARDKALELADVDEAEVEGDFLRAADLGALSLLERPDEACGVDQRVRRSGVEPGEAASHPLDAQFSGFEIDAIDVGDLVLAARRRLERLGDLDDAGIIKVEAGHRPVPLGSGGRFFDRYGSAGGIEFNHPVALRIGHVIGEHGPTLIAWRRPARLRPE